MKNRMQNRMKNKMKNKMNPSHQIPIINTSLWNKNLNHFKIILLFELNKKKN